MKKTTIIFLLFILLGNTFFSKAQESNWYSTSEIDFVFNNKILYLYADSQNVGYSVDFKQDGFLLRTYALQYDYNYMIFSKLSLGILSGLEIQTKPNFSMIKLGRSFRYFFVDKDNANLYIQLANNFSLNKSKFKNGVNSKIGLSIPIFRDDAYNISIGVFAQQNFFNMSGANGLLNFDNEFPNTLTVKSYGLGVGVKF